MTELTTEDDLPSGLNEYVVSRFRFFCPMTFWRAFCRSAQQLSASSAPPRVAPVRPPPVEQPSKGFAWEDYEGVQVDGDTSSEDDSGWGVGQNSPTWVFHRLCHHGHQLNHVP
jgi:hypothetical protein